MDGIQQQIAAQLRRIENEHQVTIPLAVESGSRAWGFASPDSDYDCRFIYVRPLDRYLSVFPVKDTIDYQPDAVFDVGGWDLQKVVRHIVKSNAVMLEWLSSQVVYRRQMQVYRELRALAEVFFSPVAVCWHYLSLAKNKLAEIQREDTAKLKTYCYVLRPLACIRFVQVHESIPHMEYRRNLEEIPLEEPVREQIAQLLETKAGEGEGYRIPADRLLLAYFQRECAWAEEWLGTLCHEKNRNYTQADAVFRDIVKMVNAHDNT